MAEFFSILFWKWQNGRISACMSILSTPEPICWFWTLENAELSCDSQGEVFSWRWRIVVVMVKNCYVFQSSSCLKFSQVSTISPAACCSSPQYTGQVDIFMRHLMWAWIPQPVWGEKMPVFYLGTGQQNISLKNSVTGKDCKVTRKEAILLEPACLCKRENESDVWKSSFWLSRAQLESGSELLLVNMSTMILDSQKKH